MPATNDFRITGALGFAGIEDVMAHSAAIVESGRLDLTAVNAIDSAGVSLLLELTRRGQAAGKPLQIRGANAGIRSLVEFFKVDSLLRFVD